MIHHFDWTPYNYKLLLSTLLTTDPISTGEWQSMNVGTSKAHMTHELEDVTIIVPGIPDTIEGIQHKIQPDLPWAEEHFLERVSGIPYNPPPSHLIWPYAVRGNADHLLTHDLMFDHTYPERFWPTFANVGQTRPNGRQVFVPHNGIRFEYGDLSNVVDLIIRSPLTRQAYLPVWFPEDTGASAHKGPYDSLQRSDPSPIRVPCTLGYHFMVRDGKLSCRYYIRSCDVMRHLTNDIYLACRLTQWMVHQINERKMDDLDRGHDAHIHGPHPSTYYDALRPGRLVMHISSLHAFVGDVPKLKERINARS